MVKPILYASELSPAVRSVLLVARAIDFELDIRQVNLLAGEHLKPEFLKMNPQHTVPTMDDNGFILWESHAICTYLIDRYAPNDQLYPKNAYARARINQRLHFNSSILFTGARPCTEAVFHHAATDFPQSGINQIHQAYDFMEAFLLRDGEPFFGGSTCTVADYCLVANFSMTQIAAPLNESKHTQLTAWFGRMKALPFYEDVNGRPNELFRQFVFAKLETNRKAAATRSAGIGVRTT